MKRKKEKEEQEVEERKTVKDTTFFFTRKYKKLGSWASRLRPLVLPANVDRRQDKATGSERRKVRGAVRFRKSGRELN